VDVVRDVLDKLVVDRNRREMGRVDGIETELRDSEPPLLSAILIGPAALGSRLHPTLGRWIEALEHAFNVAEGRPVRIEFGDIEIDSEIKTELTISQTAADAVEQRVRAWLKVIPGNR